MENSAAILAINIVLMAINVAIIAAAVYFFTKTNYTKFNSAGENNEDVDIEQRSCNQQPSAKLYHRHSASPADAAGNHSLATSTTSNLCF